MIRSASLAASYVLLLTLGSAARAADVTLDGTVVPDASSTMSATVNITEFRDGTEICPRLLPGCPKLGVCIASPRPVAGLDGQLVSGAATARFAVGIEDGRVFQSCLLSTLDTKGGRLHRQYEYCLRCEGVTGP